FSGDGPGWPVRILAPGSYLLTTNLVVPNSETTAIKVSVPSVSIDLGGFEIVTAACLGASADCTPASTSHPSDGCGIYSTKPTSVKNGSVTGMGSYGIGLVGSRSEVTNVRVRWNARHGIYVGGNSVVSASSAYANGQYGILGANGSSISGNIVAGNGTNGMFISQGSTISGNSVYQNGSRGILANNGSTISGNTVSGNASEGIQAYDGSMVSGNTVRGNGGWGLTLVGEELPGYTGNVISNNANTVQGGAEFGENLCEGNTTCP
ncbi:MAG: right-handed parallel beta-helix repeat-containing protein, partial [Alphaproteobacteria bacterium]|nr:right-handed parallel beta-helix repeat-containing protein [Alphaproteobacteria bacterium]